jgi:hypothetical protein
VKKQRESVKTINTLGNSMCECESFRNPGAFTGWNDFDSFLKTIKATPYFFSVPVKVPRSDVGLQENWYQCSKCKEIWRLVEPDPPFGGLWEKVN